MGNLLWIPQGFLALEFMVFGLTKLVRPRDALIEKMPWIDDVGMPFTRVIAAAEILGSLGLVLPTVLGIAPILTPLAAAGLALIMAGAIRVNAKLRAWSHVGLCVVNIACALVVIWGRLPANGH